MEIALTHRLGYDECATRLEPFRDVRAFLSPTYFLVIAEISGREFRLRQRERFMDVGAAVFSGKFVQTVEGTRIEGRFQSVPILRWMLTWGLALTAAETTVVGYANSWRHMTLIFVVRLLLITDW